jgi:hypothetical protein
MSYLRDYRALKMTPVDDGFMEFGRAAGPGTASGSESDELSLVS